jgi:phosphoribosylanthranilate isomerase
MLIKICGVQDPEIAAFTAQAGAHFIGMVITAGFRRSVSVPQAQEIAEAAREHNAVPVAIFVAATSVEIEEMCRSIHIDYVQTYRFAAVLPSHLKRIYVNEPHVVLRPNIDFLLMENKIDACPPAIKPWFIAGGLTPENVKQTILRTHPDGVDVSSGVETDGVKDRARILQFIEEVKSCE